MVCSKCKKNRAVVFVKKLENGKAIDEGYCLMCAKELGITPINDMIEKMGITDEDMANMEEQFSSMMEMMENGEVPEELAELGGMNFMDLGGMLGNNSEDDSKENSSDTKTKEKDKKKNNKNNGNRGNRHQDRRNNPRRNNEKGNAPRDN